MQFYSQENLRDAQSAMDGYNLINYRRRENPQQRQILMIQNLLRMEKCSVFIDLKCFICSKIQQEKEQRIHKEQRSEANFMRLFWDYTAEKEGLQNGCSAGSTLLRSLNKQFSQKFAFWGNFQDEIYVA